MKRITVLIAEDEEQIADLIEIQLVKEGYDVVKVADGQAAVRVIHSQPVDLAILDIMMPEMDGYEAALKIRADYHMPIIFVSAKTSDFDKIQGLVIGADDYVTKPFNPMELVARVNAQLRRYMKFNQPKETVNHQVLEIGELDIYQDERKVVLHGGMTIELTPKEFDILYLLASNPKKVFSVEQIFQHVWGEAYYEGANTVMVHIRTLRKKLGEDQRKEKMIKTVWGVGYTFHV